MYQLNFTLKQHTPIIHFQHDQHGATLRATEVKPKLDRFILEKLGKESDEYDINEDYETTYKRGKDIAKARDWLIDKDKGALDYKMRIEGNYNDSYYLPYPIKLNSVRYPNKEANYKEYLVSNNYINFEFEYLLPSPYFANADKIKFNRDTDRPDTTNSKPNEIIWALKSNVDIIGKIETYFIKLKEMIEDNLSLFFLQSNFGTRQNKGFGSYTTSSINFKPCEVDLKQLKRIFIKKSINARPNPFEFILSEYNLLKSGQNNPRDIRDYKKSKLFEFFIKKNIRWEKRYIKQCLNRNGVHLSMRENHRFEPIDYNYLRNIYYNQYQDSQINDYKYIRALLGLAENFEYSSMRGRLKVKIIHNPTTSHLEKIDRFQSPIFFKVIDNIVYLGINDSFKLIEGASFGFNYNNNQLGNLLKVPSNFDLEDFINSCVSVNWTNL